MCSGVSELLLMIKSVTSHAYFVGQVTSQAKV